MTPKTNHKPIDAEGQGDRDRSIAGKDVVIS